MEFLFDGPEDAPKTIALAHGAGAPMDSPFLAFFAEGLAAWGFRVARFEFPYMAERRIDGKKRGPNRPIVLEECWHAAIRALDGPGRLIIGGKSKGGRIAGRVAGETGVSGLVCLGYPFHPPGRPEKLRTAHLETLDTPTLIVQGSRDIFGTRDEVGNYGLSGAIRLHWLEDGDHNFTPRKRSGRTEEQNRREGVEAAAEFVAGL